MSAKSGKPLFRSSIRGFNKEDVNKYIHGENRRFESLEKNYITTIDSLKGELVGAEKTVADLRERLNTLADLETELASFKKRCASLESDLEESKLSFALSEEKYAALLASSNSNTSSHNSAVTEYEATIEGLRNETVALKSSLATVTNDRDDALDKVAAASEENGLLREQISDLRALLDERDSEVGILRGEIEGLKQTAARMADRPYVAPRDTCVNDTYVEAEAAAKELLRRAREAAEDMLRRAEVSSDRLLERAQTRAVACRADMITTARELISSVSAEVHRSVDECSSDFIRSVRSVFRETGASVTDSSYLRCEDEFSGRIARMQAELDRTIEEKLSEFDRRHGSDN